MADSRQNPEYRSHRAERAILLKTLSWHRLSAPNSPSEKASVLGEIVTPSHPWTLLPGYGCLLLNIPPELSGLKLKVPLTPTKNPPLIREIVETIINTSPVGAKVPPTLRSNKEHSYIDRYNIYTCQHFSMFPLAESPFVRITLS